MFKKILARAQKLQRRWLRWWSTEPYMPCSEVASIMIQSAMRDRDVPVEVQLIQDAILSIIGGKPAVAVSALKAALDELAKDE